MYLDTLTNLKFWIFVFNGFCNFSHKSNHILKIIHQKQKKTFEKSSWIINKKSIQNLWYNFLIFCKFLKISPFLAKFTTFICKLPILRQKPFYNNESQAHLIKKYQLADFLNYFIQGERGHSLSVTHLTFCLHYQIVGSVHVIQNLKWLSFRFLFKKNGWRFCVNKSN